MFSFSQKIRIERESRDDLAEPSLGKKQIEPGLNILPWLYPVHSYGAGCSSYWQTPLMQRTGVKINEKTESVWCCDQKTGRLKEEETIHCTDQIISENERWIPDGNGTTGMWEIFV